MYVKTLFATFHLFLWGSQMSTAVIGHTERQALSTGFSFMILLLSKVSGLQNEFLYVTPRVMIDRPQCTAREQGRRVLHIKMKTVVCRHDCFLLRAWSGMRERITVLRFQKKKKNNCGIYFFPLRQ